MREALLNDSLPPLIRPLDPDGSWSLDRRRFLQVLGIAGVGLALLNQASATSAAPAMIATYDNAGAWRDCVTGFVEVVCPDPYKRAINARLRAATLFYAPEPTDFHSYFSASFIFRESIEQYTVVCSNGFEVDRFPLYGTRPCESCQDLNASEIRRITNVNEMKYYDCVVSPVDRRENRYDHASYLRTIKGYPYNPNDFNVGYFRNFRTADKTVPGFYISHKTKTGPSGKPLGDILLGEPV